MEVIKTEYSKNSLSVPTEERIDFLLKRDSYDIDTKYIYVDLYLGSMIKNMGLHKTQSILNKYLKEDNFFLCQHIQVDKLNFGKSKVFTPHCNNNKFISIPHYSVNVNNKESDDKMLFSFMGTPKTHNVRKKLISLYPNNCFDSGVSWGVCPNLSINKKSEISNKYTDLVNNSVFSLCPRGTGISTIRLFEVMGMGSIPVIIADNYCPPMKDNLDWSSFSVTIKEKDISEIKNILGKYNKDDIKSMNQKVKEVYKEYFSNDNLHKSILCNIKK